MTPIQLSDPSLLRFNAYIGGEWVGADSGAVFPVLDPASGEVLAQVANTGATETARAIEAAHAALPAWSALLAKDRSTLLRRFFELIVENVDDLAMIITREMGKPLAEARGEVLGGANYVEWFAEEAKRTYGEVIPSHARDLRLIVVPQPIGVVAAITPWNFPSATIARKIAPALAAGCTVVVKPAEDTPLSGIALAALAERAGIPVGVVNVVPTSEPTGVGGELVTNPTVRKISFTGSTAVGKTIMAQGAATMKKFSLELGGNAPFIVFDDADLDAAVAGAMICKYRNGGQTCICANRIYVQDGIYEAFSKRLAEAVNGLRVGGGLDGDTDIGPLINEAAVEKVRSLVEEAQRDGANVVVGGAAHDLGGLYYQPTIMADVSPSMSISQQEIFGPVATLFRFSSEDEVVRAANATPSGLAAYFYTKDLARSWRVGEALEYGMVGINSGLLMTEVAPFGGIKESGFGREGAKEGLAEYLVLKYLAMGGIEGS